MIYLTLILFNFCHWLGDYTHLSNKWMLDAKKLGTPLFPIFTHALIHATLFFFVVLFLFSLKSATFAFLIQLLSHFIIDVLKGKINYKLPKLQNPANKFHWWVFGIDQYFHQLFIIIITYLIN